MIKLALLLCVRGFGMLPLSSTPYSHFTECFGFRALWKIWCSRLCRQWLSMDLQKKFRVGGTGERKEGAGKKVE